MLPFINNKKFNFGANFCCEIQIGFFSILGFAEGEGKDFVDSTHIVPVELDMDTQRQLMSQIRGMLPPSTDTNTWQKTISKINWSKIKIDGKWKNIFELKFFDSLVAILKFQGCQLKRQKRSLRKSWSQSAKSDHWPKWWMNWNEIRWSIVTICPNSLQDPLSYSSMKIAKSSLEKKEKWRWWVFGNVHFKNYPADLFISTFILAWNFQIRCWKVQSAVRWKACRIWGKSQEASWRIFGKDGSVLVSL